MDYYTVNENFISDIHQGYVADAKKLMEHELFDANYSGEHGSTHLGAVASSRDNPEIMKALIDKGADPRQNPDALIYSSHWGHLGNMAVLIEHGADIHAKQEHALVASIEAHQTGATQMLINKGADVEIAIPQARNIKEETAQWVRDTASKIKTKNKLDINLPQKDSYEDMMKKLGIQHKGKQEQSITKEGKIKI
ncbi:ankyrin repeat domain-containing protein [Burkholderia cenocepacia]|uniref:ankyrin repeat domain-containing protein n=1 Tax=Burkholderia cenocepacia TaxID=95486 RepID=UPI00114D310D|nr:ankyrin repeat domain-containing protein [Burkholderia cenocepacia]